MTFLSTRHALPYLAEAQAQKHVTVNEGLRRLDALVHAAVKTDKEAQEPAAAAEGDAYLLPPAPTGPSWSSMSEGHLVVLQDGAWEAYPPLIGMVVYVEDEGRLQVFTGADWLRLDAPQALGVNTDPDTANKLAVKSDQVLFSHDDVTPGDGNMRVAINKAAAAGTASIIFQTGFAGRAEIGLSGSDNLAIRVADDQGTYREAILIDRATGAVSFPNTP
ncbi:MAG: DUF2793 domain-containing protein [Parvularcula sp.]|nr:DUF2793 domain-containing protein [Parvularcula sp.]